MDALQYTADQLLPLFDNMPSVRVKVGNDPHFKTSKALAFWRQHEKTIYIRPDYFKGAEPDDLVDTLKHELIHVWTDWKGFYTDKDGGHGEAFIRKAISLGINLRGTLAIYPGAREIYNRLTAKPVAKKPPSKLLPKPVIAHRPISKPVTVYKPQYVPKPVSKPATVSQSNIVPSVTEQAESSFKRVVITGWILLITLTVLIAVIGREGSGIFVGVVCVLALISLMSKKVFETIGVLFASFMFLMVIAAGVHFISGWR